MEDNEKQIKLLTKRINKIQNNGVKDIPNFTNIFIDNQELAEELLKYYQPKLPKDSVVLSKEDKAKLIHMDTLKNIKSISQLKELLNNITAINDLMGYNDRELEIRQNESKETAERDFNAIIKALEERKERVKSFYGVDESVGVDVAIRTVKELAKQFDVEINNSNSFNIDEFNKGYAQGIKDLKNSKRC